MRTQCEYDMYAFHLFEAIPTILLRANMALTGSSWCLGKSLVPFQGGPVARDVLFFLTDPVAVGVA